MKNNLKKFYGEHRIFMILMITALVCLIAIIVLAFKYFYFGSGDGDRHTCVDIDEGTIADLKNTLRSDKLIKDVEIRVSEKSDITFITLSFNTDASLVEAQGRAVSALDGFSEEERACYDFQFTIKKDATEKSEGFNIMGASNAKGTKVSWNNNTKTEQ